MAEPSVDLSFSLVNKIAVVTGGASGIGRAIVGAYARQGATVIVFDRAADALEGLTDTDGASAAIACDVTDEGAVARAVQEVVNRFGRIDVLVNCAGLAILGPAEDLTIAQWNTTLAVNLTGAFTVSQHVGRIMLAQGRGSIISLASQAGTVALSGHVAYCVSKAGLIGLTKVLALEWAGRGVTANTISPTVVLTPLGREFWDNPAGDALRAQIPTGRFALPEEIAAAAVFLASDSARMINGADLLIDGGYTIR